MTCSKKITGEAHTNYCRKTLSKQALENSIEKKPDSDAGMTAKNKTNNIIQKYSSSRLQTKVGITFFVLAVLISALLTFAAYINFRAKSREYIRQRLYDIVGTAALQIDGDVHATLVNPAQEGGSTYMEIKHVLQDIRKAVPDLRFVYTWRRNANGQLIFVVDAETDPNEISHLGDVYDSGEPAILAQLATLDRVMVDETLNADKWGVFLSGYAPFYRSDGQFEGILGMDIKASDVLASEHRFLWTALVVFIATVPLTLSMGLWFGRKLAAPIVKLTIGSERITQGDLSHRVSVDGSYETNILAQSFNKMTDAIQKAITYRDEEISNRKKAESALDTLNKNLQATVQQLDHANHDIRSFAYIASHDLKTPLRGVKVLVDWIASDYADKFDDNGRESVNLLKTRIMRMYNYIESIRRYIGIGYAKETKVRADSNELVHQVIDNLAPPENIAITIKNKLPVIKCEKNYILQIFRNLLSNAVYYMDKPHGLIEIGCTEEDDCWKFSVADNGPGIDEKYHDKIFEMFQTLSIKDRTEKVGIGLTIVKKIVELYNGKVWVESKLGEGSTFFFTLPKQSVESAEENKLYTSSVS
jgi:signal transduction histidine kinase